MDLVFERGSRERPAGHALVYFSDPSDGTTLASYLVVLPIALELSRYVPPMLASQLPLADVKSMNTVPLPPVPEKVEGRAYLERLAELRRDDLIAGGTVSTGDVMRLMTMVGEVAQQYAQLYEDFVRQAPVEDVSEPELDEATVSDVLYELMSDQQRLAELAKLAGQLRYAVDGSDARQVEEISAEMRRLARHLPVSYEIEAFIEAVKRPGSIGQELSALYLERCYKLSSGDYVGLDQIDHQIERLRGSL